MAPDTLPPPATQLLVAEHDAAASGRRAVAALIGADFSALSITPSRADRAPGVVRGALPRFALWDADHETDLAGVCVSDLGDAGASRMAWADAFDAISQLAGRAWAAGPFLLALGGDHSVTWPLVHGAAAHAGRIGIVQVDAHHDVRPLDHGPSNGTPFRGLVEHGVVGAGDIVQLGIHPFANRRALGAWCDEQGIRRMSLAEVDAMGPSAAAEEALRMLAACDAIWISVDIDVLDRAFAPGTVAALPGGMDPETLCTLVRALCSDSRVRALDVVEFDPERDVASVTAWNVAHVIVNAVSAVVSREGTDKAAL